MSYEVPRRVFVVQHTLELPAAPMVAVVRHQWRWRRRRHAERCGKKGERLVRDIGEEEESALRSAGARGILDHEAVEAGSG